MNPDEKYIKAGLRFHHTDAHPLLELARRAELRELQGAREFYAKAAIAADLNEPLIITALDKHDLERQVAAITAQGIRRPAIDALPNQGSNHG